MSRKVGISREDFCRIYIPMALDGKSAADIAEKLGVEGENAAQFVTVKASQIRASLKKQAEAVAVERGLSSQETDALVSSTVAKVPTLKTRNRNTEKSNAEFLSFLDSVISEHESED